MILPPTSEINHHHKVISITMSPTSLSPIIFMVNHPYSEPYHQRLQQQKENRLVPINVSRLYNGQKLMQADLKSFLERNFETYRRYVTKSHLNFLIAEISIQEIARKWRKMSAKDKSRFNNRNETQTVIEKKSVAGSRSESGLSEHGLGNVSVSMTSSSVSTASSSVSTTSSFVSSSVSTSLSVSTSSSISRSSFETESDSDTASSETSDSDSVVVSARLRTSATDSDIDSDSDTDSDTDTDSVKGRTRASAKLCSKVSSEESLETSTSVESETESFEFEYAAEEAVPEDVNADDVDEDTEEIAEEVQIKEGSEKNSKSDKKKRKSAFEVFSGQEWNRINASRQEKPQREELIEFSKVNLSF